MKFQPISHLFLLKNRKVGWGICLFVLVLIPSNSRCTPQQTPEESNEQQVVDSTDPKAENPHWISDGCRSCHKLEQEQVVSIETEKIDVICLDCHDGLKASDESHPIGQIYDHEQYELPTDWPLVEGRLGCITCHDVIKACRKGVQRPMINPIFLRGSASRDPDKFCAGCHKAGAYRRIAPHIMIKGSSEVILWDQKHEIDEGSCLFCHQEVPDLQSVKRTGQPKLRMDLITLCKVCHPKHVKYYKEGHMGARIKEKMLAFMTARELLGFQVKPRQRFIKRLEEAKARPFKTMLEDNNKITCTTCHNPHQEGVFLEESNLSLHAMWQIGPGRIISPSADKKMCSFCHD